MPHVSAAELADEVDAHLPAARAFTTARSRCSTTRRARASSRASRKLGWTSECDVIMVARRPPDRRGRHVERRRGHRRRARARLDRELAPRPARVLRPMSRTSWSRTSAGCRETIDTRFFAARVEGRSARTASSTRTAGPRRSRTSSRSSGSGSAAWPAPSSRRPCDEARAAGHDLVFLIADRRDWPKELYGKLGFDVVGRIWEFLLPRAG